jgi:hypothetical protein
VLERKGVEQAERAVPSLEAVKFLVEKLAVAE